jgi:uncharacterized membrane protein
LGSQGDQQLLEENNVAELIAVGFQDPEEADRVLLRLSKLKKEYLIDLEDAVVVVRDEEGKVHLKQSVNLVSAGATSGFLTGSMMGALVGMLFLNPLAGFVVGSAFGAGAGALSGSLSDYGINDDFIKSVAETIPRNSSALFILVRKAQPERVLAELAGVKGKILHTSLSPEQEKKLQEALEGSKPATRDGVEIRAPNFRT